jgi:ubiquinol-cytochrome c reductase cytochrome c1 subunit
MRRLTLALLGAALIALPVAAQQQQKQAPEAATSSSPQEAAEPSLPTHSWSFDGPFGTYDRASVQRGFQIYSEVCSQCHSMNLLHYRDLGPNGPGGGVGYSEDEVKVIAATPFINGKQVTDGPNDQGEMFQRPGRPSDPIARPFANDQAARAANNGALPPDLSLITKAREDGPNYVYAILTGFKDPPQGFKLTEGTYYDEYFPGHQIKMPPPLSAVQVKYADGTPATVPQMAHDVVSFLEWAAEPTLEQRHRMGLKVMLFLIIATGVFYAAKRKIWSSIEH